MNVVTELTLESLGQHESGRSSATAHASVPRGATSPLHRRLVRRPLPRDGTNREWFANVIVGNASTEGWGAAKLWYLAGKTPDEDISSLVQQHARDEAPRHSRMYSRMVGLVFPGAVTEALQAQLKMLAPIYRFGDTPERLPPYSGQDILDNLLQINVAEIRTLVNQLLARPVLMTLYRRSRGGA